MSEMPQPNPQPQQQPLPMPSPSPITVLLSMVPPELVPAIATPIAGLVAAGQAGLPTDSLVMIHLGWQFTAIGCIALLASTVKTISLAWIRTP